VKINHLGHKLRTVR